MSKSVEEVSKLTESTYKVGTGENTTGAGVENSLIQPRSRGRGQQLGRVNFPCDLNQLGKRRQVFPLSPNQGSAANLKTAGQLREAEGSVSLRWLI